MLINNRGCSLALQVLSRAYSPPKRKAQEHTPQRD
jgi:hypothetical protein